MLPQQKYNNHTIKKQQAIVDALEARNVWKLKELALSPGGLLNDALRRQGWPLLVGALSASSGSNHNSTQDGSSSSLFHADGDCYRGGCATTADRALMEFDVARGTSWTRQQQQKQQQHSSEDNCGGARTARLLHCMRQCIPYSLRYFQGFHHVASVVLSTMEEAPDKDDDDDDDEVVLRQGGKEEEDPPITSRSELEWHFTTEQNLTALDGLTEEEKKQDDDSICSSSDESMLLRELPESPPALISDQAQPESARSRSCQRSVLAPPPTIQRHHHFDLLTTTSAMEASIEILHRLSLSHFADSMSGDDLLPLQTVLRLTILPMLAYFDPSLHEMLWNSGFAGGEDDGGGASSYSFCLPFILTWFSSDRFLMEQREPGGGGGGTVVKRLFDAFVAAHPLLPVYVTVAVILANRKEIITPEQQRHNNDNDDSDDFCRIHATLAALPRQVRDWDDILDRAIGLMRRVPPKNIVPLAERYYGAARVRAWLGCRTPQMLQKPIIAALFESRSRCFRVPTWKRTTTTTSQIARIAAGYGEGDAAMRKSRRRRRRVAAATLLMVFAASVVSRYCMASRPTDVDGSTVESIQYSESFSSATDGLDAFDGSPVDVAVADIENTPVAPTATLSPKVVVATFLALYLRNFLFVSSGSVERLEAQLLFRINDDPHPPVLLKVDTDLQH